MCSSDLMLIPISIAVYTINCLVTGSKAKFGLGCNVLAWMNSLSILVTGILILLLNMSGENVLEEGFTNPSDLVGNYNFSDGTSIQLTDINEFNVDGNVLLLTSPDNFPNMPNNYIIGENNTLIKINTEGEEIIGTKLVDDTNADPATSGSPAEQVTSGSPAEQVTSGSPAEQVTSGSPAEQVTSGSPAEQVKIGRAHV